MAAIVNDVERGEMFDLVHPLFDEPEMKRSAVGRMEMGLGVRVSLFVLRVYLTIMILLVFYSVLHQAGAFGH